MPRILHLVALAAFASLASAFFDAVNGFRPFGVGFTRGVYPQDFNVVGPPLEPVHDSQNPPTGLAVDTNHNVYLTYPRNQRPTPNNVVKCVDFNNEVPWPSAAIQNCRPGQVRLSSILKLLGTQVDLYTQI